MKCSICHDELPDVNGVCPGRLPGPLGLIALSSGPCASTPETRARADAERAERQVKAKGMT
jgi:hypothetical protein